MPDAQTLTLRVEVPDAAAELFLIDGDFRLVKKGVGSQSFEVPPGIYKIKCRSGRHAYEQMVVVRDGMAAVQLERVMVNSSMPLEGSMRTHEYHMSAAGNAESGPKVSVGTGSGIIIVARQWTSQNPPSDRPPLPNPARALALRDASGAVLVDVEAHTSYQGGGDPIVTLNVELAPGEYSVTRVRPDGSSVSLPLVASAGWLTHVYILVDEKGVEGDAGAELVSASITIRRPGAAFHANDLELRSEEIARCALRDARHILSAPVRAQFTAKGAPPMLALIGGHLIARADKKAATRAPADAGALAAESADLGDVRTIVANLREALGAHPDVEALASLCGVANDAYVYRNPPMLRSSWSAMLDVSCRRPAAVPVDSITARVSERVWGEGPWLLWVDRVAVSDADHARSWQARARELVVALATKEPPAVAATMDQDKALVADVAPPTFARRTVEAVLTTVIPEGARSAWKRRSKFGDNRARTPFPSFANIEPRAGPTHTADEFQRARTALTDANRAELVKEIGVPLSRIDAWLEGTAGE